MLERRGRMLLSQGKTDCSKTTSQRRRQIASLIGTLTSHATRYCGNGDICLLPTPMAQMVSLCIGRNLEVFDSNIGHCD